MVGYLGPISVKTKKKLYCHHGFFIFHFIEKMLIYILKVNYFTQI